MSERCWRCAQGYAAGRPEYFGSDPQCAFPEGIFSSENWNCLTANALRDMAEPRALWSEDQYAAILPSDGAFVLLSWYKHRGRTEGAWYIFEDKMRRLTLQDADNLLARPTGSEP